MRAGSEAHAVTMEERYDIGDSVESVHTTISEPPSVVRQVYAERVHVLLTEISHWPRADVKRGPDDAEDYFYVNDRGRNRSGGRVWIDDHAEPQRR